MAKITIVIEDTDEVDGHAMVSWEAEPDGVLHSDGTSAEQIAYMVLNMLAGAAGKRLPKVTEASKGEAN